MGGHIIKVVLKETVVKLRDPCIWTRDHVDLCLQGTWYKETVILSV